MDDVQAAATATIESFGEDALAIVPVRNFVLFPGLVMPITIARSASVAAAQAAVRENKPIGILLQRDPGAELPGREGLHDIGVIANVVRYITAPDGAHHLICQGAARFKAGELLQDTPYLVVRYERVAETDVESSEIEARFMLLKERAAEALTLIPDAPAEMTTALEQASSPGALADLVAAIMEEESEEKQAVLESIEVGARLDRVIKLLSQRIEVLRISRKIGDETRATLDQRQREFVLREQLAAIQRELGEGDDSKSVEITALETRIADAHLPPDAMDTARREIVRIKRMPEASTEYGMARAYLDWLIDLPWALPEPAAIDIAAASRILDEDHFGLGKIKRRIVEYLAVRKLVPRGKAPILCFVGPPGVGKTSLGQSIARAMGRKFVRVSLGGVHDEAEIRGHRRTYIGAMPGNIIQAIRKAGSRDCVMMLDEIDKMGAGIQGDPSAAMLEVLDPEQNATFRDAYLGVPFDLSSVVFIATANMLDTISTPLRDRMELIALSGYTDIEKLEIAKRYLVRRQCEANGLTNPITIEDDALIGIIRGHTREAGVRNLEREIARVFRKIAVDLAQQRAAPSILTVGDVDAILGAPRFDDEVALRTATPGVATGLAWTPVGGDILFIEAIKAPGSGKLTLTGQLGEVMRESAQAALSLLRSSSNALGIDAAAFEKSDIHVHVPAGATPKDGPSAGVALYVALMSLFTGRAVRSDTAMTGEISLRGLVLPVGGIREKVTAAARAGLTRVLLPARNKRDLDDIPADARERLEFVWLETVDDARAAALTAQEAAPVAA